MYVEVIAMSEDGLTHRQATEAIFIAYGKRYSARNGGLGGLVDAGFLKVVGERTCDVTGKLVSVYDWTGRVTPRPSKDEFVQCDSCEGKGGHVKKVYYDEPVQTDLFQ